MASSKEFKSKDDWRKEKELDEARKNGTAPALKDEEGNDINPHIPQYIANAPWYLSREAPSLKHQRIPQGKQTAKAGVTEWYARGVFKGKAATKWKKGACENCGATSHKTKECVERPRAKGAKWTNTDLKPDEYVRELEFDFEGKRDRWNGYDPAMHDDVVRRFEKTEQMRRKMKQEQVASKFMTEPDPAQKRFPHEGKKNEKKAEPSLVDDLDDPDINDEEEEELKEGDDEKADFQDGGELLQSKDPRTRTTIRNLRIREDTAKYLRNLSLDSAYYDPKTRSMRECPTPHKAAEDQMFGGDNFVRTTGDAVSFGQIQRYAWEAYEKGQEIHVQASPSQAELLHHQFQNRKKDLQKMQKESILKKYGGADQKELPQELRFAQTEAYVEYSRDGTLIKGQETKVTARSKYEEDVYKNNHTSVWGSYWESGEWGYSCCRQTVRNSYCTGEAGKHAREALVREMQNALLKRQKEEEDKDKELVPKGKKTKEERKKEEEDKKKKLEEAIRKEEEKAKEHVEKDERKRKYNSASGDTYEVSEEEMEAYRLKRTRGDDPMAAFLAPQPKNKKDATTDGASKRKRDN
jgi:pre-mRNA-processing factor SLU7